MKHVQINWFLSKEVADKFDYLEAAPLELEPFFQYIQKIKNVREQEFKDAHYTKCYAFIDFAKNMFVYRAPIDMDLSVETQSGMVRTHNLDQEFFDYYVKHREWGGTCGFSLGPGVCFYADEPVTLEVLPLVLIDSPATTNVRIIPGTMDIGQTIRPLDFTGEIIDKNKPIQVRRGNPLFLVRFTTQNNTPVTFKRVIQTKEHALAIQACAGFKKFKQNTPLRKLYKALDPTLRALGFKKDC